MPCELLLLRHGKTASSLEGDDFNRPLKDSGKRNAQRVGAWLARNGLRPDLVLASPAERARVTAEKCCKVMGIGSADVVCDARLYLAGAERLQAILQELGDTAKRVLLVGHNPGLTLLLDTLTRDTSRNGNGSTGLSVTSIAHLECDGDWKDLAPGRCRLRSLVHAGDLPKKFPYPSPHGTEQRDRPAYYYTQSAVIPYRRIDGQTEVLIIRSSKNKHWVVPKGIADPGLSLQASAAKEAIEEAGVEGLIDNAAIGSYSTDKWGATCTVEVFPMRVTRIIPESEWEEHHRGRRWVSPQQAAELLHQPQLRDMALKLAGQENGD